MDLSGVIMEKFIKCLTKADLESDEMVSTLDLDSKTGTCSSNCLFHFSENASKITQQIW